MNGKVFLHVKGAEKGAAWKNTGREFDRLPCVGEYIATESNSPYYRVVLVVHCPFEAQYVAEVYAAQDDRSAAQIIAAAM